MSRKLLLVLCALTITVLLSCQQMPPQPAANENKPAASSESPSKVSVTDLEAVSNRVVTQVAGIKEGDTVFVHGSARDLELLENLVTDSRKLGAHAMLTVGSDRMSKNYYQEVPEKYDTQAPDLDLKLATLPTVAISVDTNEAQDNLANVSPSRLANVAKTLQAVGDVYLKRNVKQVEIGNGLYPTATNAKQFGITQDALAKTFWDAVNADYAGVQATGEKVKTTLSAGKELHITSPDGTDLKVKIEGRQFLVSDGIISADDVQKGGPAVFVYLPAGEVYCAPAPGSAEGKLVITQDYYRGKEMTNVIVTFVGGKITSMTGSGPGYEALKKEYDAVSDPGKELLSYVDFGINPNLKIWPASKIGNWVQAGMVSLGTGNNIWAGGDNKASAGVGSHLGGCTVTLDGKTIIEKGEWKQ
jgi:leucyl aminopeptidase (aminopeptidase T)